MSRFPADYFKKQIKNGETLVSQLPTDKWHTSIGDDTMAGAILDRLIHDAYRLQLKEEFMSKILTQLTEDEHFV